MKSIEIGLYPLGREITGMMDHFKETRFLYESNYFSVWFFTAVVARLILFVKEESIFLFSQHYGQPDKWVTCRESNSLKHA